MIRFQAKKREETWLHLKQLGALQNGQTAKKKEGFIIATCRSMGMSSCRHRVLTDQFLTENAKREEKRKSSNYKKKGKGKKGEWGRPRDFILFVICDPI